MSNDQLTPEQQTIIDQKYAEWLAIGLSTEEMDRDRVLSVLPDVYTNANLVFPGTKYVYFVSSPKEGLELSEVLSPCDTAVAGFAAVEAFRAGKKVNKGKKVWDISYGCHRAGLLGFYDCIGALGYEDEVKSMRPLIELGKVSCWTWFFDQAVIVSDKPVSYSFNDMDILHNDKGPAIEYRDGYKLWVINGITVNEQIVIHPETLTAEQIKDEKNAEVRRIMIERFGPDKYISSIDAKVIDNDPDRGILYRIPGEDMTICEVVNSTFELDGKRETYWLIGPERMRTAQEFVAASFGLSPQEYQPSAES